MQIWKSPYTFVFMYKLYPENFAFLIQRILVLFMRETCKFPYSIVFWMFLNKHFT